MKKFRYNFSMNKQRGAALLILAVVMILTVVILMVGKKSRNAAKSKDGILAFRGSWKMQASSTSSIVGVDQHAVMRAITSG